jgi:hypothetical protein
MEELRRRLERLLGKKPAAPIDQSQQRAVAAEMEQIAAARRDKVAAAGGELLGAAIKLLGELVDTDSGPPSPQAVEQLRDGLIHCTDRDPAGRPQLRLTLPDDQALDTLATALAKLLVAKDM